ncbi:tyrosine-type recombinase/integrase [Brevibacterium sp. HMSC063G07]|uniref:tyrosine-type recombinase/integrase n=1 Tax=Brevibacterium sp. HMSC063G07 TaxID=1739261 RepID=UPI0008A329A9|nr:tyrosine-type recombinase/integrase [Brevibacterium sp. HMSC063G07]OFL64108.1 hypothetical protein HMPREF2757_01205 [Brevibacterium sp. HMSC063G07]
MTREISYRLIRAIPDPEARLMALFLQLTGCRISKATALKVEDLNIGAPEEATVTIRSERKKTVTEKPDGTKTMGTKADGTTKTSAGARRLPLPRELALVLNAHLGQSRRYGSDYVFQNRNGVPFNDSGFRTHLWHSARRQAGITIPHAPHDLRHSWISGLAASGLTDIMTISKLAGHRSITTTADRYGHLTPDATDILRPHWTTSTHRPSERRTGRHTNLSGKSLLYPSCSRILSSRS